MAAPPYPWLRAGAVLSVLLVFPLCAAAAEAPAATQATDPADTLEYWLGPAKNEPVIWRAGAGVEYARYDLGSGIEAKGWQNFYALSAKRGGWTAGAGLSYQSFDVPSFPGPGNRTLSGLGDTTLFVRYDLDRLFTARDWFLSAALRIKAPTASAANGLGTGKFDEALSADALKVLGPWALFAYGGYTWRGGATSGRDAWNGAAGADYKVSPRWNAGLSYEWRQRAFNDPLSSFYGYGRYRLTDSASLTGYGILGVNSRRPDLSVGLQIAWFGLW